MEPSTYEIEAGSESGEAFSSDQYEAWSSIEAARDYLSDHVDAITDMSFLDNNVLKITTEGRPETYHLVVNEVGSDEERRRLMATTHPEESPFVQHEWVDASEVNAAKVNAALELAWLYGHIDGAHHKMWVIDQMARMLLDEQSYQAFKNEGDAEWKTGTPP